MIVTFFQRRLRSTSKALRPAKLHHIIAMVVCGMKREEVEKKSREMRRNRLIYLNLVCFLIL
ncbi:hypothetical protein KA405_05010 [Patescibacteria group bacterium]|nr:hypothetical protein [Patescibacteria group bacterium]